MEILNNFGFNPILFIAQIVNFTIVFILLKKLLYKPILTALKNREKTIKDGLKQAEAARILIEKTTQKEQEILKKAQAESKKIIEATKKQSNEILQQAEQSAKKQTEQILAEARKQILFETKEAQKNLSTQISVLAVQFLQKSAAEMFGKEEQNILLKKALQKLKNRVD